MKNEKGEIITALIIGIVILVGTTVLSYKTQEKFNMLDWTAENQNQIAQFQTCVWPNVCREIKTTQFQSCDWPHVCFKDG